MSLKRIRAAVAVLLLFLLLFPQQVMAEDVEQVKASLRVYPVKIEMPVEAGEGRSARINVENTAELPAEIIVYARDFIRDEQGNYTFYEPGERDISMSAASWLTLSPQEVELLPGQSCTVEVELSAPENAEPGGHYTMVFVEAAPKVKEQDIPAGPHIISNVRSGVLILGTVAGELHRLGSLESLTVPRFNFSRQVPVTVTFENEGNVHFDLAGLINFEDWQGRRVGSLSIAERTSLPDSRLEIRQVWEQTPLMGKFTASARVVSRDGEEWVENCSFWVLPLKEGSYLLGLVILLAGVWYMLTRKFQFRIERR